MKNMDVRANQAYEEKRWRELKGRMREVDKRAALC